MILSASVMAHDRRSLWVLRLASATGSGGFRDLAIAAPTRGLIPAREVTDGWSWTCT